MFLIITEIYLLLFRTHVKSTDDYNGTKVPGTDTYSRTNKVFGLSLNYMF